MIEMLIVLAIIAVLAGIMSLAVSGFVRDARIETANNNAQMVYMAFQDIIMDCEIKQDNSIFEGHEGDNTGDIIGAVVFFRVSATDAEGHANKNGITGLGDEIHVMCMHKNPGSAGGVVPGNTNLCSRSFWIKDTANPGADSGPGANGSSATSIFGEKGAKTWNKFNTYISGRMDSSMEGTYVVAVDLENYQVISVICRNLVNGQDPKTGLYSAGEVISGQPALSSYIAADDVSYPVRAFVVDNFNQQKTIYRRTGVTVGCYPMGDAL